MQVFLTFHLSYFLLILLSFDESGLYCYFTFLLKVNVVSYTFVRRGVPVREDTYPKPSACEEGWPVPFLAAFISPVLLPTCCWVNSERVFSQDIKSDSNCRPSAREAPLTTLLPRPTFLLHCVNPCSFGR